MKLPDAIFSQHIAVLGKTRSGKSSVMRLFVEQLLDDDKPVCVVDPKGDWHGLRSSADGKRSGYPVVIFGGEHADIELNQHAGAHVAEVVATGNRPCIIDLGGWMVGERTRFFVDFASNLFRQTRGHRWLVIDEVHNFAPQGKVLDPDAGKMLHWANRLASEGLGKGLAIISASQRPQKVHKDYLTCAETLIAMRVTHPLDRRAVQDWIDGCGDPVVGKEVLGSLADMKRGEGWAWSPEAGFGPKRTQFPMFKTYDSFRPRVGEGGKLKGWAAVNLDDVRAKFADAIEQAKANDPAELKRRIAELEKELRSRKPAAAPAPEIKRVEVPVLKEGQLARVEKIVERAQALFNGQVEKLTTEIAELRSTIKPVFAPSPAVHVNTRGCKAPMPTDAKRAIATIAREAPRIVTMRSDRPAKEGDAKLDAYGRRILAVLAMYPEDGCAKRKLTLLSGYRWSGGFSNALGALRAAGLIEGANTEIMRITADGLNRGPFQTLPTGRELVDYWERNPLFGAYERETIKALRQHPSGLDKDRLCEETGYLWSGGLSNALGALRTAGVIVGKNTETMRLSDELLEALSP